MNRRGFFGAAGAMVVAACTPELAAADAPLPRAGHSTPSAEWYARRLHLSVLRGEEVCSGTSGPLHDACARHLKLNEATSRITRQHGYLYWRTPRSTAERGRVADIVAMAALEDFAARLPAGGVARSLHQPLDFA